MSSSVAASTTDMYRGGVMPVGTTEPPSTSSSSQQMLQPRHTTSMKMQDSIMCHPALGNYNTTATNPSLMSRRKELGILEPGRPNFLDIPNVETKRKWTSDSSSTLDHSQLWLRRDQDLAPKLSPGSIPVTDPAKNITDARSKQFVLSRLLQEISQAEPSRQWIDVHDKVHSESNLQAGRPAASFRHDRNASASPSDHAMSEDHAPELELRQARSPDVDELKRTGSVSSDDVVDVESVRSGRGRSQSRNNSNRNITVSKNLVSERKRRKKLNDGLYSLRALVPKISKMDKASIVGDAIEHVKELQQQIEDIESEIAEMESECPGGTSHHTNLAIKEESGASRLSESEDHVQHGAASAATVVGGGGGEGAGRGDAVPANTENVAALASTTDDAISLGDGQSFSVAGVDQKRILKTEVSKLEDRTYQLQISCQKGPGVLVQLTKALESMDMDVLNAYHTSFQEIILNTFIVEIRNLDMREAEDVRSTLLDVVAQHGLAAPS